MKVQLWCVIRNLCGLWESKRIVFECLSDIHAEIAMLFMPEEECTLYLERIWSWGGSGGICCTIWYACSKSFAALENVLEICTLYLNHGSKLRLMSCLQLHCKPWYYRKMQTNEVVIAVAIQLDLSNLYVELQLQWPQFRTMIWIAHVSLGKALW
jgi:hypothetical protein